MPLWIVDPLDEEGEGQGLEGVEYVRGPNVLFSLSLADNVLTFSDVALQTFLANSFASFVSLDGEQTITGAKIFAAPTRMLTTVRVRPSVAGAETSITFFHDADELARASGDIWRAGISIQPDTARNFMIEAWGGPWLKCAPTGLLSFSSGVTVDVPAIKQNGTALNDLYVTIAGEQTITGSKTRVKPLSYGGEASLLFCDNTDDFLLSETGDLWRAGVSVGTNKRGCFVIAADS